jgi:large subunit ribosomal protein L10
MHENPLTKAQEAKKVVIEEIREKFAKADSAILIDYIGMTVAESTELRNQFRAAGVDFKVYKNTLIDLALQEQGIKGLEDHLKGSTAIAFSYDDPTAAAKVITKFINKVKKTSIKVGVMGEEILNADKVEALADVPTREVLLAMLLGVMNGPVRSFARCVDLIREQKESA